MKFVCFLYLLTAAVFRLVNRLSSRPDPKLSDTDCAAVACAVIVGFLLQITALWLLSGYSLIEGN